MMKRYIVLDDAVSKNPLSYDEDDVLAHFCVFKKCKNCVLNTSDNVCFRDHEKALDILAEHGYIKEVKEDD